jgi:hypothetical protein
MAASSELKLVTIAFAALIATSGRHLMATYSTISGPNPGDLHIFDPIYSILEDQEGRRIVVLKAQMSHLQQRLIPEQALPVLDPSTARLGEATMPSSYAAMKAELDGVTADPAATVWSFFIPASADWGAVTGSPTFGPISTRLPAWTMPKAESYLAFATDLPSHWTKMKVELLWVNLVANAGNVSFSVGKHEWTVGESINAFPSGLGAAGTAPATPLVVASTMIGTDATPLAVNAAKMQTLRLQRNGTSANDTLPNAIAILGVVLHKVA